MSHDSTSCEYDLNQNLLGEKLRDNAQKNVEERTQAIYNYLLDIAEKASNNGNNKIRIYASDDTAVLFKDKRVYTNVVKMFKEEKIAMRLYPATFWNERAYIGISW